MTNIAKSIAAVQRAYDALGGKEFSRRAAVPYTTLLGWAAKGFRPAAIEVLEKLEAAADLVPDGVMAAASQNEVADTTANNAALCGTGGAA